MGIGLAALISGADKYFAFDVVKYANTEINLKVFDELVTLFKARADIPGDNEFPKVKPYLDSYAFPHNIFDDPRLKYALENSRLEKIRESIIHTDRQDSLIKYRVPWFDPGVIEKETVDMIYSQAVLEHVDDLESTYETMHLWLKLSGHMSHEIDFKCHSTANEWNGHWAYSDFVWKLIKGRRPYLLNREPHSTHVKMLSKQGFRIMGDQTVTSVSRYAKRDLATRYLTITDDDLVTSSAFILSTKQQKTQY